MKQYLDIHPDVTRALAYNLPIVALESTIISHGMPYPDNVKTAKQCEEIIKKAGAVPATIAILNGKLKVGLTSEELDYLGKQGHNIKKTSRRDIAFNIANKIDGATTVSATMFIAHKANIKVFATGGIGGVHRGAESTMDISADLEEFARTPVFVVSAGAKSILDLGLTLEYMETKGVPILGYKTDTLPAFYSRDSEFKVPHRVNSAQEIASILFMQQHLQLETGILIANPIPKKYSMSRTQIDNVIDEAIVEMDKLGIKGKETTPYLLSKIVELTKGKSLESNIALVYNNCKLAAEISVALRDKEAQHK